MQKTVYTTFDISRLLDVDITTVMIWIDKGNISAYKTPGGHRRVLHDDFISFLKKFNMPIPAPLRKKVLNVLVVEDNPGTLKFLNQALKKINSQFNIETALDGFEAGRKLEKFSPDLVVLDLNLPGIDGFRICKNIRSNEKKRTIKIIAISGFADARTRNDILKCGADEFLEKPFGFTELNEAITLLLQSRD